MFSTLQTSQLIFNANLQHSQLTRADSFCKNVNLDCVWVRDQVPANKKRGMSTKPQRCGSSRSHLLKWAWISTKCQWQWEVKLRMIYAEVHRVSKPARVGFCKYGLSGWGFWLDMFRSCWCGLLASSLCLVWIQTTVASDKHDQPMFHPELAVQNNQSRRLVEQLRKYPLWRWLPEHCVFIYNIQKLHAIAGFIFSKVA